MTSLSLNIDPLDFNRDKSNNLLGINIKNDINAGAPKTSNHAKEECFQFDLCYRNNAISR